MSTNTIINNLNEHFKMPIYYNKNKSELKKNIVSDLELVETVDPSCNSIYSFCFNNDNDVSLAINNQISNYQHYYSNDNNNNLGPNSEIKQQNNVYIEYSLDQIDPNNIMSDPVISEQFRKLYAEDEYFQAVHRKCSDWLHRYVMPEFELLQAEKIQK